MFKTLINIFRVPELRNKVLFTLFMLAIYRIGYHVPLPGVDQDAVSKTLAEAAAASDDTAAGRLANYVSLFSGGNLSQSTIFGLGMMPYISASIIFQLSHGHPVAGKAAEGRRDRPQEDPGMDALRDRPAVRRSRRSSG